MSKWTVNEATNQRKRNGQRYEEFLFTNKWTKWVHTNQVSLWFGGTHSESGMFGTGKRTRHPKIINFLRLNKREPFEPQMWLLPFAIITICLHSTNQEAEVQKQIYQVYLSVMNISTRFHGTKITKVKIEKPTQWYNWINRTEPDATTKHWKMLLLKT